MKVPPKRKGNNRRAVHAQTLRALNESPSEKEGKSPVLLSALRLLVPLNESPSEKEGKFITTISLSGINDTLNESPSEKEGK